MVNADDRGAPGLGAPRARRSSRRPRRPACSSRTTAITRACRWPGVCRMCLVEVEKFPKLAPSCATTVGEGQVVHVHTEKAREARKGVLEFLLINHPLDCPICDQAGECELQDYTFQEGRADSRYREPKRFNPVEDFGGDVLYVPTAAFSARGACASWTTWHHGSGAQRVRARGPRLHRQGRGTRPHARPGPATWSTSARWARCSRRTS
jgi:hypothetical protein